MPVSLKTQFPPVNAILAQRFDSDEVEMFYPIFPSHLMMPLKVGEVVWVLYPDQSFSAGDDSASTMMGTNAERLQTEGSDNNYGDVLSSARGDTTDGAVFQKAVVHHIYLTHDYVLAHSEFPADHIDYNGGYWLSRVAGTRLSEDTNYTCYGRDFDERAFAVVEDRSPSDVLADGDYFPGTPNKVQTSTTSDEDVDPSGNYIVGDNPEVFSQLKQKNDLEMTFEATPRISKHPGDFIIQGSNNTAIILGENPSGIEDDSLVSGGIDIVAGRGLHPDSFNLMSKIANDDARFESDKCHELSEQEPNLNEGTMDVFHDFSRIVVSANAMPDVLFCDPETTGASENITFSSTVSAAMGRDLKPFSEDDAETALQQIAAEITGPTIAMKSDHIRIVGRETLRLMVESPDGPASAPEIILHKDGNIFIKPGVNGQVYIGDGPDAGEPGTAVFADMLTYPDDMEGGTGFAAEMAVAAKIPTRHSPKVKVKI
tara:strand:- start:5642 stop:7096 length:1455 start_codon:yes stop_codon:yes gene_type:complete